MKLYNETLLVNIFKFTKGISDIYCRCEDIADFLNFESELEPLTFKKKTTHISHGQSSSSSFIKFIFTNQVESVPSGILNAPSWWIVPFGTKLSPVHCLFERTFSKEIV